MKTFLLLGALGVAMLFTAQTDPKKETSHKIVARAEAKRARKAAKRTHKEGGKGSRS